MQMKLRNFGARILAAGLLAILSGVAAAQPAYPSKPIRVIIPYTPGSTPDTLMRLIGPKMTETWGQPVIVDLRPGGNTVIGGEALVKSPPDGYTFMAMTMSHVITPQLFPMPFHPIKDFTAVATLVSTEQLLVVNPSVPANNLKELIALAKSRPGQLNYGSVGSGGTTHLAMEFLGLLAGIKMQHVPYKGSVPALTDLLGGQVQMFLAIPSSVVEHIKSGRVRPIAVSGETRLAALPQVPTFAEAGLPEFTMKTWFGVVAPANTPKPVVDQVSAEIGRILALPEIREKLLSQGVQPFISTPEQFAELMRVDMAKFAKVIQAANIKVD
jgi:tripartite-type tricarboxylate transporter receptor subunit TctC